MLVLVKMYVGLKQIGSMFNVYLNNASWEKGRHLKARGVKHRLLSFINMFKTTHNPLNPDTDLRRAPRSLRSALV